MCGLFAKWLRERVGERGSGVPQQLVDCLRQAGHPRASEPQISQWTKLHEPKTPRLQLLEAILDCLQVPAEEREALREFAQQQREAVKKKAQQEKVTAPIDLTRPLTNPSDFFGRKKLLQSIAEGWALPSPRHFLIYGEKAIGKTSLLNFLQNSQNQQYRLRSGQQAIALPTPVRFSLIDFKNCEPPKIILKRILRDLGLPDAVQQKAADFGEFNLALETQLAQPSFILLDNPEQGLRQYDEELWGALRALSQRLHNGHPIGFVVCSRCSADELSGLAQNGAYKDTAISLFFNIFVMYRLEALEQAEAVALLDHYKGREDEGFDNGEMRWMLQESQQKPYTLLKLCDFRRRYQKVGDWRKAWRIDWSKQQGTPLDEA